MDKLPCGCNCYGDRCEEMEQALKEIVLVAAKWKRAKSTEKKNKWKDIYLTLNQKVDNHLSGLTMKLRLG